MVRILQPYFLFYVMNMLTENAFCLSSTPPTPMFTGFVYDRRYQRFSQCVIVREFKCSRELFPAVFDGLTIILSNIGICSTTITRRVSFLLLPHKFFFFQRTFDPSCDMLAYLQIWRSVKRFPTKMSSQYSILSRQVLFNFFWHWYLDTLILVVPFYPAESSPCTISSPLHKKI